MFWDVLGCFESFLDVLLGFGHFWLSCDVLGRFAMFWLVLGHFGTHSMYLIELQGSVKI